MEKEMYFHMKVLMEKITEVHFLVVRTYSYYWIPPLSRYWYLYQERSGQSFALQIDVELKCFAIYEI